MKYCKKCALPETYPNSNFNSDGICSFCMQKDEKKIERKESERQIYLEDLEKTLKNCRGEGEYDCLVGFSGGKDSIYLIHKLVNEYKLRVLTYTVTHALEPDIAHKNIDQTLDKLNVFNDTFRYPAPFCKKLFRYLLTHQEKRGTEPSVCYICGRIRDSMMLRIATEKKIPLIMLGYSPYQVDTDKFVYELSRDQIAKKSWLPPFLEESGEFSKEELDLFWNPNNYPAGTIFPRFLAPFHAWDYNPLVTVNKVLELGLSDSKKSLNPAYTNCEMIWMMIYSDLKLRGYNAYANEFSQVVRDGKYKRFMWELMQRKDEFCVNKRIYLGKNVTKIFKWLGIAPEDLAINRAQCEDYLISQPILKKG